MSALGVDSFVVSWLGTALSEVCIGVEWLCWSVVLARDGFVGLRWLGMVFLECVGLGRLFVGEHWLRTAFCWSVSAWDGLVGVHWLGMGFCWSVLAWDGIFECCVG